MECTSPRHWYGHNRRYYEVDHPSCPSSLTNSSFYEVNTQQAIIEERLHQFLRLLYSLAWESPVRVQKANWTNRGHQASKKRETVTIFLNLLDAGMYIPLVISTLIDRSRINQRISCRIAHSRGRLKKFRASILLPYYPTISFLYCSLPEFPR